MTRIAGERDGALPLDGDEPGAAVRTVVRAGAGNDLDGWLRAHHVDATLSTVSVVGSQTAGYRLGFLGRGFLSVQRSEVTEHDG